MRPRISGTYRITNTAKGIPYLGSSKDIMYRWSKHRAMLRKNAHFNPKLQNAWNKYGEEVFAFEVIEYLPEENLQERETYWIEATWPFNYNISSRADRIAIPRRVGWKHSSVTCARISAANLGRKHRPYTQQEKEAQSLRLKGKVFTEDHKHRISMARRGKDISPEARRRQAISLSKSERGSNNPNFGHRWDREQRSKMSRTLATEKYDFTCDRCRQIFLGVSRSSYGGHRRKCLRLPLADSA
jgi:group I intron endonuclease